MADAKPETAPPRLGSVRSVQVPGGMLQLAKIVENRMHDGRLYTLVCWIDVRRDAEWVPSSVIPPEESANV